METAASRKETAIWLLERMVPDTGVNNVTVAVEVDGRLDRAVLAAAVRAVVNRHEALRTVFTSDGAGLTRRVLDAGTADVALTPVPVGPGGRDADLTAFAGRPFALDGRVLVRAGVWAGPDRDVCCVVAHHLVFDAMSAPVVLRELLAAYAALAAGGRPDATPGPVAAQREPDARSLAYWRRDLDGLRPAETGLWCARPPAARPTLRAGTVHHELSAAARGVVRRLQRDLRASEAVVLLAAYGVLLAEHGAGDDVVIGTPVSVRDPRAADAVGYHANLVPLRLRLDRAAGFRAAVRQARSTFLEAISHADVPLEHVSPAVLGDAPSTWRSSFFRHLFNYVPGVVATALDVTGMPARPVLVENGYSRFDLEFFVMPGAEATTVRAAYCVDAFDAADVRLLLERYDALLAGLGDAVDRPVAELPRWGATDRAVLGRPAPDRAAPDRTVPAAVHAVVAADPHRVAVLDADGPVTYGRLWAAALGTRDLVAAAGAPAVAVLAPRGAGLAAAWLGAWLAGAPVVLLDPLQPVPDLAARLTDSGAGLVLAAEGVGVPGAVRLPAVTAGSRTDPPPPLDPAAPAYLEYAVAARTPVAVTVGHRALAHAAADLAGQPAVTLWLSSAATAESLLELVPALAAGGRVVVAPDSARSDGHQLAGLLDDHGVEVVQGPATLWRQVAEQAGPRLAGRTVLVPGPLPAATAAQLGAAGARVRAGYRTPGAVGYATAGDVFVTGPGTTDEAGIGVRGELCVTGPALADGYHARPDLTAARFGEHPRHGRFHRTGDRARLLPDGTPEVSGPVDATVLAAGQRVHLADLEAELEACADVDAVAVAPAGTGVVAFVAACKPGVADRVREHARATLPVVPEVVVLDRLPLTVAGTVDRPALAGLAAASAQAAGAEPPDGTTTALIGVWTAVLDRPGLHADANFFASGGHSLLGAQLVQRVKTDLGLPVQLADLFANPTPRQLAAHLESALWDDEDDD